MNRLLIGASCVLLASAMIPGNADAVIRTFEVSGNAASNCQGALPSFEGALRKRPLAVQNEGTTTSFVTCAFNTVQDQADLRQISYFGVYLTNTSSAPKVVTCSGVAGFESGTTNVTLSKQVTVPAAGGGTVPLFFQPADNGGNGYYPLAAMSCQIPTSIGITDTYVGYAFDDR